MSPRPDPGAECAHASDRGLVRVGNEDRVFARGGLLAVADGVGGGKAGETAAEIMIAELEGLADGASVPELVASIERANRLVRDAGANDPSRAGMATTACVIALRDDHVDAVHVGDSRAYVLRAGTLDQITEDHSLVAELVRSGAISPAEAAVHPNRNMITRAVGAEDSIIPEVTSVPTQMDDVVLVCTDGLSGQVSATDIASIIVDARTLAEAAANLVARANGAGGMDNVSVVLARVVA